MAKVLSPGALPDEPTKLGSVEEEYIQNLGVTVICPECKEDPPNLIDEFASGDTVCASCGLVLQGRMIDTRSEWRTFSNDDQNTDDPSRVGEGPNALLNGSQLQTNISFGDGGVAGRDLHRAQMKVTHDQNTKSLLAAYKQIGAYCDSFHVSANVTEYAKHLFKLQDDAKALRGKSTDAIIASAIFIACRQQGVGRSFREIHDISRVSKKEIGRTFKQFEKFLTTKHSDKLQITHGAGKFIVETVKCLVNTRAFEGPIEYQSAEATKAVELCERYCNQLGLNRRVIMYCTQFAARMDESGVLAGRSPISAAAAAIYLMSHLMGQPQTPKQIAEKCGVSDGTIRTSYRQLYQHKDKLIDPTWLKEGKGGDMSRLPPV